MNAHNKTSSRKVNIYSSINDLIMFKIVNIELNYSYKTDHSKNYKTKTKRNNQYERRIKNFFEREIVNYACRRSPVLSESFWEIDPNNDIELSSQMNFRFENKFKDSKLRIIDKEFSELPKSALENLRKIEFFSWETFLETETIHRSRDFDVIHSYLIDAQKKLRGIFDIIIKEAIFPFEKKIAMNQPFIQKDLMTHLFNLDKINLLKPELSLRIRKCITKETFTIKSDCKTPYFYANKLEENKYCSKTCKIDFPLFENATNKEKKVKRRKKNIP